MCRSTDYQRYMKKDGLLKIKAFFIHFSGLSTKKPFSDSLTLLYPPRINEAAFELDGSKIRPDSPAFVTLYRVVGMGKSEEGEAVYGSREKVKAGEGVRFEVYMREEKVLKGIYRRDYDDDGGGGEEEEWKMECQCEMEGEGEVEVCVAVEGHVAMNERVDMVRRRRVRKWCCLEEIPEEREVERQREFDGGCCCTCGADDSSSSSQNLDVELEGVRWALDVGIWVMCLGIGYLVSKASAKSLRRRRSFF